MRVFSNVYFLVAALNLYSSSLPAESFESIDIAISPRTLQMQSREGFTCRKGIKVAVSSSSLILVVPSEKIGQKNVPPYALFGLTQNNVSIVPEASLEDILDSLSSSGTISGTLKNKLVGNELTIHAKRDWAFHRFQFSYESQLPQSLPVGNISCK